MNRFSAPVRVAQPPDLPAVIGVVNAAYEAYVDRIGGEPAPMTADHGQAITDGTVRVLEHAGRVVGVLVLHRHSDHLLVENIAVEPRHQGNGSGTRLLRHTEQEATRYGLLELRLYTHALMTENIQYHERRGFVETNRRVDGGYARVFFRRPVART